MSVKKALFCLTLCKGCDILKTIYPERIFAMNHTNETKTASTNDFSQMAKNNVDSKNQLKDAAYVRFHNPEGNGVRIMFVGNSITLHGVAAHIGWNRECGMAASSLENDYVHILERAVREIDSDAVFCICQAANWEREYKNGSSTYHHYAAARDFDADIIIFRCIENCSGVGFDRETFYRELGAFIDYLNSDREAKIIVTTGFWRHPGDEQLRAYARNNSFPLVELGDLGEDDKMKAIGLFDHSGVANHPGDEGMKNIAERIAKELLPICNTLMQ